MSKGFVSRRPERKVRIRQKSNRTWSDPWLAVHVHVFTIPLVLCICFHYCFQGITSSLIHSHFYPQLIPIHQYAWRQSILFQIVCANFHDGPTLISRVPSFLCKGTGCFVTAVLSPLVERVLFVMGLSLSDLIKEAFVGLFWPAPCFSLSVDCIMALFSQGRSTI